MSLVTQGVYRYYSITDVDGLLNELFNRTADMFYCATILFTGVNMIVEGGGETKDVETWGNVTVGTLYDGHYRENTDIPNDLFIHMTKFPNSTIDKYISGYGDTFDVLTDVNFTPIPIIRIHTYNNEIDLTKQNGINLINYIGEHLSTTIIKSRDGGMDTDKYIQTLIEVRALVGGADVQAKYI